MSKPLFKVGDEVDMAGVRVTVLGVVLNALGVWYWCAGWDGDNPCTFHEDTLREIDPNISYPGDDVYVEKGES